MTVASIMTTNVKTLHSSEPFSAAQEVLKRAPFHHLLIQDDNHLVGIVSDRDMMSQVAKYLSDNNGESFTDFVPRLRIADVMTRDMIVIDRDTAIDAASILLLENNISCLPVVDSDHVIEGIVTWKDLLKYYVYI